MAQYYKYGGSLTVDKLPMLKKLVNRQSEAELATKHHLGFVRDEILEPALDALEEKFEGNFEDIPIPVGELIRRAIKEYEPSVAELAMER